MLSVMAITRLFENYGGLTRLICYDHWLFGYNQLPSEVIPI